MSEIKAPPHRDNGRGHDPRRYPLSTQNRTCSIPGCNRPYKAKGYCKPHYGRLLRYGDPRADRPFFTSPDDRFWSKVEVAGPDDCWLWQASTGSNGYAQAAYDGTMRPAHRVAWEMFQGPIPEGLHIDHLCRVRSCVNPAHLEPVTPGENVRRGFHPTKTHCKRGHLLEGDNLYLRPTGQRLCRACDAYRARKYRARKAA